MSSEYDVIIIGGGMVGSSLGCALGQSELKVCILDTGKLEQKWPLSEYDLRVSAITRASQNFLNRIGVWDGIKQRRLFPYQKMHVWDATGTGEITFDCADVGESCLGHIIENSVIQGALIEKASAGKNITLITEVRPERLAIDENIARVELSDGRQLSARLIVGADGARSWVRQTQNIDVVGWAYQQKGVVTTVELEKTHLETAWQRFLPTGPVAFLPLDETHCSIVWSTTDEESERLMGLNGADFVAELNAAVGDSELGRVSAIGKRGAFPLRLQHAKHYVRPRVALIGDAAHTIHPLAGQGVNLGFMDAALLAEEILKAEQARKDIGLMSVLRRYERGRKSDNVLMMASMDGFKRLFSNDNKPLSTLRNMGLNIADSVAPLKQLFVHHAMGTGSRDLPRMARPEIR